MVKKISQPFHLFCQNDDQDQDYNEGEEVDDFRIKVIGNGVFFVFVHFTNTNWR